MKMPYTVDNKHILVIDDDKDIWKAYAQVLEPANPEEESSMGRLGQLIGGQASQERPPFKVSYAAQGREGFELAERAVGDSQPYSVAFIDVRMPPGWDGMETAARIRQLDNDIEIVIVTAYSDRSRDEIVEAVGGCDKLLFIRKPFDAEELMQLAASLTDKWKITQEERLQRQQLQAILRTSPAAIFTLDEGGSISSWNPTAEEMTGFSQQEVLGLPLFSWQQEDQRPCLVESKGGIPTLGSQELALLTRTGEQRIVALKMDEMKGAGHGMGLIGSFWDITSLKTTEAALQASENRFRSLVEATSDWVWEMDSQGCFTYCSPICEELYGYRPEELVGHCFYEILTPDEGREELRATFHECRRQGKRCQARERQCLHKDGSIIYVESSGVPFFNEQGEVAGYRGIDRDIGARKEHEEKVRLLEEQQRQSQKLGALGTLAGGIAHDMNNILTPILGFAELAKMQAEPGSSLEEQVQNILDSSNKAADLIRQILAFSRKQPVREEIINLNSIIHDFSKMLRRLIREDIDLLFELPESIWPVAADRSQMEQVLVNLIVNARDAMENQGSTIKVATLPKRVPAGSLLDASRQPVPAGEYVALEVTDQGVGINPQEMERIFDPFYTTKEQGKGTGLGLSTVYGIISQHKGHICLHSEPGQGSTFTILLPRCSNPTADSAQQEKSLPLEHGKETILVVEDNSEVRSMLATLLDQLGYKVITAANGRRGLEELDAHEDVALVICDVVMPVMGGSEMVKRIRQKQPQLLVIFISGHTFDSDIRSLLADGRSNLIEKPFRLSEVTKAIKRLLTETSRE